MRILDAIEKDWQRKKPVKFDVGDSVDVHVKIIEGDRERIQIFAGVVLTDTMEVSSSGTRWKFKAASGETGIVRASVKALKDPGMYRVTLKTNAGWTPPGADETIGSTQVLLHVVDECFEGPATKVY